MIAYITLITPCTYTTELGCSRKHLRPLHLQLLTRILFYVILSNILICFTFFYGLQLRPVSLICYIIWWSPNPSELGEHSVPYLLPLQFLNLQLLMLNESYCRTMIFVKMSSIQSTRWYCRLKVWVKLQFYTTVTLTHWWFIVMYL